MKGLKGVFSPLKTYDILKKTPPRLIFAFHRVSREYSTKKNPFNRLAHITPFQFAGLIRLLKPFVCFKDLEETVFQERKNKLKIFLHLTFDDVSKSFLTHALPIIEKHKIPVTIFPSVKNAELGYSWRDKIYYILNHKELQAHLTKKITAYLGPENTLISDDVYSWSKSIPIHHGELEKIIDQVLTPHIGDFHKLISKYHPYLNWDELRSLSKHPLITIGNHGYSHYDYNKLTQEEIEEDIQKGHTLIKEHLEMDCRHFSVPFGGIRQESYLAIDNILIRMQYQTVGWSENANNPKKAGPYIYHYFRIDGAKNSFINLIKTLKALPKIKSFPLSGIKFSAGPQRKSSAIITETVSIEEYKTFYHRMFPDKIHHLNNNYIDHLYYRNPFGRDKTKHLAIKTKKDVFAIGSLLYIPYLYEGKSQTGAYFCGWYRLPELPSPEFRARTLFEKARSKAGIIGAYDPSSNSFHFYKDWDRVRIHRLKARLSLKKGYLPEKAQWILSDKWDSRLQPIIDNSIKNLILTVRRGPDVYKWRIEGYPLCRFHYLFPAKENPQWYVIFCIYEKTIIISDFCLSELDNKHLISEMLDSIQQFVLQKEIKFIELETSNEYVLMEAKKYHFKLIENFWTVYSHPKQKGQILPWDQVHETQLCGDLLPRIYPPQK